MKNKVIDIFKKLEWKIAILPKKLKMIYIQEVQKLDFIWSNQNPAE